MMRRSSGCSSRPLRSAVRCTWSIGSSPPSTKTKNSSGNVRPKRMTCRAPKRCHQASPGTSKPRAVHELLEHQRVLRLLDDLVVGVAELGRAVRQLAARTRAARASARSRTAAPIFMNVAIMWSPMRARTACGWRPVPGGAAERRRPPTAPSAGPPDRCGTSGSSHGDVGVGVEVLHDRLVAQARDQLRHRSRAARRRCAAPPRAPRTACASRLPQWVSSWMSSSGMRDRRARGITSRASVFSASITCATCGSSRRRCARARGRRAARTRSAARWRRTGRPALPLGKQIAERLVDHVAQARASALRRRRRSSGSVRAATASSSQAWNVGPDTIDHSMSMAARVAIGARRARGRRRRGTPRAGARRGARRRRVTSSALVGK